LHVPLDTSLIPRFGTSRISTDAVIVPAGCRFLFHLSLNRIGVEWVGDWSMTTSNNTWIVSLRIVRLTRRGNVCLLADHVVIVVIIAVVVIIIAVVVIIILKREWKVNNERSLGE
jgi:hypothetical protein